MSKNYPFTLPTQKKRRKAVKKQSILIEYIPLNTNKGGEMKRNIILSLWLVVLTVLLVLGLKVRMDQLATVECDVDTVVAQYGDTLWDIGYKHCGGDKANMEEVRYQMVKLNGDVIQPGQLIVLP